MKKSVIILIGIIYVTSIFIVGFFGLKMKAYDPIIYITDIECTNDNMRANTDGSKSVFLKYSSDGDVLKNSIIINYKVYPENSTLKGTDAVRVVYDHDTKVATVDGLTVTFLKKGVLTVQLVSQDGSEIIEKVKLIAY